MHRPSCSLSLPFVAFPPQGWWTWAGLASVVSKLRTFSVICFLWVEMPPYHPRQNSQPLLPINGLAIDRSRSLTPRCRDLWLEVYGLSVIDIPGRGDDAKLLDS